MSKKNYEKQLNEVGRRTLPIIEFINKSGFVGSGQRMDLIASFKCDQGEGLKMTNFTAEIKNPELKKQMDGDPQFAAFVNGLIRETLDCAFEAQVKYSRAIAHNIKRESKKVA